MPEVKVSKTYKFKISNIKFTVNIDHWRSGEALTETPSRNAIKSLHYHAVHELFLVADTPLRVHTADDSFEFTNCFVCIPPFFKHYSHGKSRNRLLFTFEKLDNKHTPFSDFCESFFMADAPFMAHLNDSIDFCRNEFAELFKNNNDLCDDIGSAVLKLIFYNIYERNASSQDNVLPSTNDSYLIKIDALVNDFQKDVTLQTVADALCLSTKQASRIIKKNYKKNLSDMLTEKRLEVAAALLTETDDPVSKIVSDVNFSSESYFYFQFKKMYGCTPVEYKKLKSEKR